MQFEVLRIGTYRPGIACVNKVFKKKNWSFVFGSMGGQLAKNSLKSVRDDIDVGFCVVQKDPLFLFLG